ncbi:MAG: ComEC/Rec2 family competence protein [Planctomycetales bacterium]|nr:ComEC/Rec2 family competence protein [Planctomycetales bacterium]
MCAIFAAVALTGWCRWRGHNLWAAAMALGAVSLLGVHLANIQIARQSDSLFAAASREAIPIALRCAVESVAEWRPNPTFRPGDPAGQPWRTQWLVRCLEVRDGESWVATDALCPLACEGRITDLLPGDVLEVYGTFSQIYPPTNPGAFDFADYYRKRGVFTRLSTEGRQQIRKCDTLSTYWLARTRAKAVRYVDRSLQRWVVHGQASLAAALVFGGREQVDWEAQQAMMATGTLHMLAISGLHVEIVAAAVLLIASLLRCRNRTIFAMLMLICGGYAWLAGGKPPVMRAVILVMAFGFSRAIGRDTRLANVLALAAIVLLLSSVNNAENVGVQLSFLAVGAIGIFAIDRTVAANKRSALQEIVEESLSRGRRWLLLATRSAIDMMRLSLWVWLITCPLVWYHFHVVSPIAVPLNVVLSLPLMVSLLAGLVTAVLGWLPPLAWLSGNLCGWGLSFISRIVELANEVPWGHWWLPAPSIWWILAFYTMVVGWLVVFGRRKNAVLACILCVWIGFAVLQTRLGDMRGPWAWPLRGEPTIAVDDAPQLPLQCTFLDVGHGTSVIIQFPTGEVWLYDAGHLGVSSRSHQDIATALWELRTARIDRLLISHADADHYNATEGLLERFRIGQVVSTNQFWQSSDHDVRVLIDTLADRSVQSDTWTAGRSGNVGQVHWQVLHPRAGLRPENDNAGSLCLLLEFSGKRILLPGDLEGSGMLNLVQLPARPCHILMAPHHGSLALDPSTILQWCRPMLTVISGNHRASQPAVLEKYQPETELLGITFRDGAIQARILPDGTITSWRWDYHHWAQLINASQ